MGGILRGSIEHAISNTAQNGTRDVFASFVRFFDNHPQMTRIASHAGGTGLTGAAATALPGYSGSANYSGENAFGVWRWDKANGSKVYILCQWGYNSTIGTSPGNPGSSAPNFGVGFQFAMDTSGGNPWNGGSANVGADTKNGSNVWVPNGGTLLVWPRANGPGGAGATIRQYMAGLAYPTSGISRLHILSDDDALWYAADFTNNGGYDGVGYFGPYIPHEGITLSDPNAALVYVHQSNAGESPIAQTTEIGTTTGTSAVEGGAVVHPGDGVRTFKVSCVAHAESTTFQPNGYTSAFDEIEIFLRMEDVTAPSKIGFFGKIDPAMLAMVVGIPSHATNVGRTRVAIGGSLSGHLKWLFKWDGMTAPGTGGTSTGIQF